MLIDLSIDPAKISDDIVKFIRETVEKAGFTNLILGLSGGVDSSTGLALAVKSVGCENIYVGLFPYGDLNKEGMTDAQFVLEKFQIPPSHIVEQNIQPLVDPIFAKDPIMDKLRQGNIMARMRMVILYDLAKKYQGLVLGTENKTEYLLGYFTLFGDEASDLEPIRHLYKIQVKQLADYLQLPEKIIQKPPSAGMWADQTDEGELGFSYEEADQILHLYKDRKKSREEIVKIGFGGEVVDRIITRVKNNEFKHKLPYWLKD